ncbi:sensor histidine kinase [Vibrio alfacsensis]|uniref:sensor histidine kinase n=1 Tax=Vibrio alfacsensis TaxID=1074311 RepID=UPI004068F5AA
MLRFLRSRVSFILIAWFAITYVHAGSQRLAQHVGLDANNISTIMFDHKGFMWIGTQHGLFVYDGYQLQDFKPNFNDPGTINAIDIRNLYQSKDNQVWVSTNSGGLSRFNPATNTFTNFRHDSKNHNSISNDSVYDVIDGPDDHLWIATQIGLNRLNRDTGEITRFFKQENNAHSLPNDYVYKLFVDRKDRLWVGTLGGGLAYWQADGQRFVSLDLDDGASDIFSIEEDHTGNLWVGTRSGLFKIDLISMQVSKVELGSWVSGLTIISLHFTENNTLLLGTYKNGLLAYDVTNNRLSSKHDQQSFATDTITSVIENDQGELFVSTWGNGVHLLSRQWSERFFDNQIEHQWFSLPDVSAVFSDRKDKVIWLGSLTQGLYRIEKHGNELVKTHLDLSTYDVNNILSIEQAANDDLFVGTSSGLWQLSPSGETINFFKHDTSDPGSIGKGFIRALERSMDGNVWVGIGGSGLYKYNISSESFSSYKHEAENRHSISGNYITALMLDGGYLWVGTRSSGLNRCRVVNWYCERFFVDKNYLSHYYISDIEKDSNGDVWIGTDNGGLHQVVLDSNNDISGFKQIPEITSLGQSIKSILSQDDGSIWIATNKGLSVYKPQQHRLKLTNHILSHSGSFIIGAKAKNPTHNLLGAHNGLVMLEKGKNYSSSEPFPMRITRIDHDTFSSSVASLSIKDDHQLSIPWGGMLTVEFALLDFRVTKHEYEYRLTPSSHWQALENRNQIYFFNVEPGEYQLEIRGKGSNGLWSDPAKLSIDIVPPWWRDKSYIVPLLLLTTFIAIGYHRYRMRKWLAHSTRLNLIKMQKQLAIDELKSREATLKDAYRGIRDLTAKIQNAKEEERKSISRELHDQFGQSLTATQINLQLYKKHHPEDSEKIDDSIKIIQDMIKQVRSISFDLRPSILDDVGLIAALSNLLRKMSLSLENPITFNAQANFPMIDSQLATTLFRIIQESVNNAIRHANATEIVVNLRCNDKIISAEVKDNGTGFNVNEIKQKVIKGRHLGLLGIEERVLTHHGKLTFNSHLDCGTSVLVEFEYE